jgi:hypothetical protein
MTTKTIAAALLALAAAPAAWAQAACPGGSEELMQRQILAAVNNSTMCAERGNERWQEFHRGDNVLVDYKLGPASKMDPSKPVGRWRTDKVGGTGVLVHSYDGASYSWRVCRTGLRQLTLLPHGGSQAPVSVRMMDGQVSCR